MTEWPSRWPLVSVTSPGKVSVSRASKVLVGSAPKAAGKKKRPLTCTWFPSRRRSMSVVAAAPAEPDGLPVPPPGLVGSPGRSPSPPSPSRLGTAAGPIAFSRLPTWSNGSRVTVSVEPMNPSWLYGSALTLSFRSAGRPVSTGCPVLAMLCTATTIVPLTVSSARTVRSPRNRRQPEASRASNNASATRTATRIRDERGRRLPRPGDCARTGESDDDMRRSWHG
ncbi:MAG TPA: hypothetical protein VMU51_25125 [Mycobacteriales bacterium]|nr:hypothetical protein [Mycobacteriales bacterium]